VGNVVNEHVTEHVMEHVTEHGTYLCLQRFQDYAVEIGTEHKPSAAVSSTQSSYLVAMQIPDCSVSFICLTVLCTNLGHVAK